MQIRSMDSITMSTRARVHTYTRFEIETSSPSNQIYARLVFRARRVWTEHERRNNEPPLRIYLS